MTLATVSRARSLRAAPGVALAALASACAGLGPSAPPASLTSVGLGANSVGEACRLVPAPRDQLAADFPSVQARNVFCGNWQQPAARIYMAPDAATDAALTARLAATCLEPRAAEGGALTLCAGRGALAGSGDTGLEALVPGFVSTRDTAGRFFVAEGVASAQGVAARAAEVMAGRDRGEPLTQAGRDAPDDALAALEALAREGGAADGSLGAYRLAADIASEYNARWRFRAAEAAWLDALAAQERAAPADLSGRAEIQAELALNLSNQRRYDEALVQFEQAERVLARAAQIERQVTGSDLRAAFVAAKLANYRAVHLANSGNPAAALDAARAAQTGLDALAERLKDVAPAAAINASQSAGQAEVVVDRAMSRRLGAPDNGSDPFRLGARTLTIEDRVDVLRAQTLHLQASMLSQTGRPGAAEALALAAERLSAIPAGASVWLRAVVAQERAALSVAAGNAAEASRIAEDGLRTYRLTSQGTRVEATLLTALAQARLAAGDRAGALKHWGEAFAIFNAQREQPGVSADQALPYARALLGPDPARASAEDTAAAFAVLQSVVEPGVGRSIAQMAQRAALGPQGVPVRALQDADRQLSAARVALARAAARNATPEATLERLATAVSAAQDAQNAAERAVQANAPAYARLVATDASVSAVRGRLAPDEAFVSVTIGRDGGLAAVVTGQGLRIVPVALTQAQAAAASARLRATLNPSRPRAYDLTTARALDAAILEPLRPALGGVKRITYVLPGALAGVPMGALVTAEPTAQQREDADRLGQHAGIAFAAREFAFTQAVSAASFLALRSLPGSDGTAAFKGFGGFQQASDVSRERINAILARQGLPSSCARNLRQRFDNNAELPGTVTELRAVSGVLGAAAAAEITLGADFTDAAVAGRGDLDRFRVLSFATHGLLAEDTCFTEPALMTSLAPDAGDGFLDLRDILDLRLSADLVILSACDTAAGGGQGEYSAEAFGGLARAFFYAGSRSLLASHWPLSDAAAPRIMQTLFTAARDGAPVADALAAAQRDLIASPDAGLSHPANWAALVAVGDGGRKLRF